MKTKATALISIVVLTLLALHLTLLAQDSRKPERTKNIPMVVKDSVKGSIHHGDGKKEWQRITGKAQVIDAHTLQFADGTRVLLNMVAPELEQPAMIGDSFYPAGKEAAQFLRQLIADQSVTCFLVEAQGKWVAYVGDTNVEHAMVIQGHALAHHSTMEAAEILAREHQRGLWRGKFIDPDDWRTGKRLPGEK